VFLTSRALRRGSSPRSDTAEISSLVPKRKDRPRREARWIGPGEGIPSNEKGSSGKGSCSPTSHIIEKEVEKLGGGLSRGNLGSLPKRLTLLSKEEREKRALGLFAREGERKSRHRRDLSTLREREGINGRIIPQGRTNTEDPLEISGALTKRQKDISQ